MTFRGKYDFDVAAGCFVFLSLNRMPGAIELSCHWLHPAGCRFCWWGNAAWIRERGAKVVSEQSVSVFPSISHWLEAVSFV